MNAAQRTYHLLSSLLLIGLGVALLYFYVSGRIVDYTAPLFRWGALTGGLVMMVLGIFNLLTTRAPVGCGHDHDHDHDHHDDHEEEDGHHHHDEITFPGILATFLIVLGPIITAAAYTQDDYVGGEVAEKKGLYQNQPLTSPPPNLDPLSFTLEDLKQQVDQNEEGDFLLSIQALYYSAGDPDLMKVLSGQPVAVEGEVVVEKVNNDAGKRLRLFRWFVQCCAADAMPLGIPIEYEGQAPTYPDETWLRVHGTMSYVQENGMDVPVLRVRRSDTIDPPTERMMY